MAMVKAYRKTLLDGVIIAAEGDSVTGLWFEGQRYFPSAADKLILFHI
jgi:hypothetical protein